jgi:hypothetical protein
MEDTRLNRLWISICTKKPRGRPDLVLNSNEGSIDVDALVSCISTSFAETEETFRRLAAGEGLLSSLFREDSTNSGTELTRRDTDDFDMGVGDGDLEASRCLEVDGADGYGTGGSRSGETG